MPQHGHKNNENKIDSIICRQAVCISGSLVCALKYNSGLLFDVLLTECGVVVGPTWNGMVLSSALLGVMRWSVILCSRYMLYCVHSCCCNRLLLLFFFRCNFKYFFLLLFHIFNFLVATFFYDSTNKWPNKQIYICTYYM